MASVIYKGVVSDTKDKESVYGHYQWPYLLMKKRNRAGGNPKKGNRNQSI